MKIRENKNLKDKNGNKIRRQVSIITICIGIFLLLIMSAISLKGLNKTNALEEIINSSNRTNFIMEDDISNNTKLTYTWMDEDGNSVFETVSDIEITVDELSKCFEEQLELKNYELNGDPSEIEENHIVIPVKLKTVIEEEKIKVKIIKNLSSGVKVENLVYRGDVINYTVEIENLADVPVKVEFNGNLSEKLEFGKYIEQICESIAGPCGGGSGLSCYFTLAGNVNAIMTLKFSATAKEVGEAKNKISVSYEGKTIEINEVINIIDAAVINATKVWKDNNNEKGKRPNSVILQIKNGDNIVKENVVNEENNWSCEFVVSKYDSDGNEIEYAVDEKETYDNYEKRIEGYTVINRYIENETNIKVEKIWEDNNNEYGKRPENVVLQIKNEEEIVAEMEVSEENNWSYEFVVPKYDSNGNEIEYAVDEKETDVNYEKIIDGYKVINKYKVEEEKNENKENNNDIIKNEENVDTSDINIWMYVVIAMVSIVVIVVVIILVKKNNRKSK